MTIRKVLNWLNHVALVVLVLVVAANITMHMRGDAGPSWSSFYLFAFVALSYAIEDVFSNRSRHTDQPTKE